LSLNHIEKSRKLRAGCVAAFVAFSAIGSGVPAGQSRRSQGGATPASSADVIAGRRIFVSDCASCHGLDARGGEHAPNILVRPEVQRMSAAAISRIVRKGISSKGMPAFEDALDAPAIQEVAAYLSTLARGNAQSAALPGNPANGKSVFFGKGGCAECHMVDGAGGFLGADLSDYAGSHTIDEIRDAISNPNKFSDPRERTERTVSVVTAGGERLTGIARNEDNFSLQLQTPDGAFHLLMKSELEHLDYPQQSLMPSDYAQRLDARELNDLVSFLMRTASVNSKRQADAAPSKHLDEDR
jgi:cytochrome c oxidase cbb3-type subunit III